MKRALWKKSRYVLSAKYELSANVTDWFWIIHIDISINRFLLGGIKALMGSIIIIGFYFNVFSNLLYYFLGIIRAVFIVNHYRRSHIGKLFYHVTVSPFQEYNDTIIKQIE